MRARAAALGLPFVGLAVDVARRAARRRPAGRRAPGAARRAGGAGGRAWRAPGGARAPGRRSGRDGPVPDRARDGARRACRGFLTGGIRSFDRCSTCPRAEILRYLRRRSIPFVEDPSNADLRFARARIRHRHLPLLAEENPRVAEALVALAAAARAAGRRATPAAPARRRRARRGGWRPRSERLRARGGTAAVDIAGGRRVEVSYGAVRVAARAPVAPARARRARRCVIDGPGTYRWAAGHARRQGGRRAARAPGGRTAGRVRRRPARLAAHGACPKIGRSHATARRAREPQALRPDDRRAGSRARRGRRCRSSPARAASCCSFPGCVRRRSARPTARTRRVVLIDFVPEELPETCLEDI